MAQNVDDANVAEVFPDAPTPVLLASAEESSSAFAAEGFMTKPRAVSPTKYHEGTITKWSYWGSGAFLLGGLAWDMQTTNRFMNHPTKVSYLISCADYLKAYPTFTCNMSGPIMGVWNLDPALYYEEGWAKVFGRNNSTAVIAANSIRGVAVLVVGRILSRHGGERKKLAAISANCLVGLAHLLAAEDNASFARKNDHYYVPQGAYDIHWFN